ncbi:hypothetical protein RND71_007496 [Anisodus tanguticus]|uniref:Uncharacterized protein n=1 Tax=Anisodus tanguticus TaxID=243964 RepID=A0AAE1VK66_9SOLA|nr:hypothetical protein RND71_007496 [Anisodus tanguticus]
MKRGPHLDNHLFSISDGNQNTNGSWLLVVNLSGPKGFQVLKGSPPVLGPS